MNLTGRTIEPSFLIKEYLGSGAAGDVYVAELLEEWNGVLKGQRVAFKAYKDWLFEVEPEKQIERIRREAEFAQFTHPNLVRIYGSGDATVDGKPLYYLVMEVVFGVTLTRFIHDSESLLPAPLIREVMLQLTGAVAELHRRRLVHRDVKPDNIMVVTAGAAPVVKLMDFGVIKDLNRGGITESHEFLGTVRYAAPEWIFGEVGDAVEDHWRVDLYSLGLVMCDLMNGFPVFPEVKSRFQLAELKRFSQPPILRNDIPTSFIATARGLTALEPGARRPPSAAELLRHLEGLPLALAAETFQDRARRQLEGLTEDQNRFRQTRESLARQRAALRALVGELVDTFTDFHAQTAAVYPIDFPWNCKDNRSILDSDDVSPQQPVLWIWGRFGLGTDSSRGLHLPLTIVLHGQLDWSQQVVVEMAGVYDGTYYTRRDMYDGLHSEVVSEWDWRCRQLDSGDEAYRGPFDRRVIAEQIEQAFFRIMGTFLEVNGAFIRAKLDGESFYYRGVGKITMNGVVGGNGSHGSISRIEKCLILGCDREVRSSKYLCADHQHYLQGVATDSQRT